MITTAGKTIIAAVAATIIIIGAAGAYLFAHSVAASHTGKPTPVSQTANTGTWQSTCTGGVRQAACSAGVLEVTLENGTRTMLNWPSWTPIPSTVQVVERSGQYVLAADVETISPEKEFIVYLTIGVIVTLLLAGLAVGALTAADSPLRRYNPYMNAVLS